MGSFLAAFVPPGHRGAGRGAPAFKTLIGRHPSVFRIDGVGEGTRRTITRVVAGTDFRLQDHAIAVVNEEINMLYTAITRAQGETDVLVPAVLFEPDEGQEEPGDPFASTA